jgi:hypothetical protein
VQKEQCFDACQPPQTHHSLAPVATANFRKHATIGGSAFPRCRLAAFAIVCGILSSFLLLRAAASSSSSCFTRQSSTALKSAYIAFPFRRTSLTMSSSSAKKRSGSVDESTAAGSKKPKAGSGLAFPEWFAPGRLRVLTTATTTPQANGKCVLYWMARDQRADDNYALLLARHLASQQNVPVAVVFNLTPPTPNDPLATLRAYGWMFKGLKEVEAAAGLGAIEAAPLYDQLALILFLTGRCEEAAAPARQAWDAVQRMAQEDPSPPADGAAAVAALRYGAALVGAGRAGEVRTMPPVTPPPATEQPPASYRRARARPTSRPPPAPAGGQARTGRPRSRGQGDRDSLRRHGL